MCIYWILQLTTTVYLLMNQNMYWLVNYSYILVHKAFYNYFLFLFEHIYNVFFLKKKSYIHIVPRGAKIIYFLYNSIFSFLSWSLYIFALRIHTKTRRHSPNLTSDWQLNSVVFGLRRKHLAHKPWQLITSIMG